MTLFVSAAFLSTLFFFLLLQASPSDRLSQFAHTKAYWVAVVSVFLALSAFLVSVYVRTYHDDHAHGIMLRHIFYFFSHSDAREIVFGFVYGIFFSYWLDSIIHRDSRDASKSTFAEVVYATLLVAFLILGLGGEQTISALLFRVTDVKLPGGAEVALSQANNGQGSDRETALFTLVPPSASTGPAYAAPDTSGGLSILRDLPGAITRDALYYALRECFITLDHKQPLDCTVTTNSDHGAYIAQFQNALNFVNNIGLPDIAECFNEHVSLYGDDDQIGQLLVKLGRDLRAIAYIHGRDHTISGTNLPSRFIKTSKSSLDEIFSQLPEANDVRYSAQDSKCKKARLDIKRYEDNYAYWQIYGADPQMQLRPYLWSAAAASLAFYHDYAAAISLLDEWLMASENKCPIRNPAIEISAAERIARETCEDLQSRMNKADIPKDVMEIFQIRVRGLITSYIEEWMSYQPIAKTKAVSEYHAANLEQAIYLVERIAGSTLPKISSAKTPADIEFHGVMDSIGDCANSGKEEISNLDKKYNWDKRFDVFIDKTKEDTLSVQKMQLALVVTLNSMKRAWLDAILDSDEYLKAYAHIAKRYADDMVMIDYCYLKTLNNTAGKDYALIERVLSNNYFARVEMKNVSAWPNGGGGLDSEARLLRALDAATLALNEIRPVAKNDRDEKRRVGVTFLHQISSSDSIDAEERLTETIRELNDRIKRN